MPNVVLCAYFNAQVNINVVYCWSFVMIIIIIMIEYFHPQTEMTVSAYINTHISTGTQLIPRATLTFVSQKHIY